MQRIFYQITTFCFALLVFHIVQWIYNHCVPSEQVNAYRQPITVSVFRYLVFTPLLYNLLEEPGLPRITGALRNSIPQMPYSLCLERQ